MGGERLRGGDVSLTMTVDGVLEETFTAITDMDIAFKADIISKGYIGQQDELQDSVAKGCAGSFGIHTFSQRWLIVLQRVRDFQRRRDFSLVINLAMTLYYPNGDTPSIVVPKAVIGTVDTKLASQADYLAAKWPFAAGAEQIVPS